jgi:hypothetical protein
MKKNETSRRRFVAMLFGATVCGGATTAVRSAAAEDNKVSNGGGQGSAAATTVRRFDFGTGAQTEAGHVAVGAGDKFTPERGWGWLETDGLDARDRSGPDALRRDFIVSPKANTFRVAGLPPGRYRLTVIAGDVLFGDHVTRVRVAGAGDLPLLRPSAAAFATLTTTVTKTGDAPLDLVFDSPEKNWVVNAVRLEPVTAEEPARITLESVTPPEPVSMWGPVLTWEDPTAALLAGHRTRMKAAPAIKTTGLKRADYLRLIAGEVDFWKTKQAAEGAIIDPYRNVEFQYSTPAFAHAAAALVAYAGRKDLTDAAARALAWSARTLADRKAASAHEDFYAPMLAHAIRLLKPHVSAERSAGWEADIRRFDPFKTYRSAVGRGNWNVVALSGEALFQQMGLRDKNSRFVEASLAGQGRDFGTPYGLYLEGPMPYDHFPRLWAADMLAHGYDGPYHKELGEMIRRAAVTSLFMQSPWGELPAGGRSAHHQWNEAEQCVTYEIYGAAAKKAGDDQLAAIYKRAARLALRSMFRWVRPSGEMQIVKNWVDPAKGHAFEGYSAHSQYNLLPMSMLAIAYEHAESTDGLSEQPAPADVGGYVLNIEPLHKVFANAGGAYVELDTAGDHHYDATGLIRVHLPGVSPQLGPSDSVLAHPTYRVEKGGPVPPTTGIGVAWQGPDGTWHHFGELSRPHFQRVTVTTENAKTDHIVFRVRYEGNLPGGVSTVEERFVLTPGRVEVMTRLPGYAGPVRRVVPVLASDGKTENDIQTRGATVTVAPGDGGKAQTFTATGAASVRVSPERYPNHNGWARLAVAEYAAGAGERGVTLVIAPKS